MTRLIKLTEYQRRIAGTLMEAFDGNLIAQLRLKVEAISTADFPVAFQQVNNAAIQAKLAEYTPVWPAVARRVTVDNLLPAREMRLDQDTTNLLDTNGGYARIPGTLPRVPELTEYPTINFTASKTEYSTAKNGARVHFSWEAFKNDQWSQIQQLPGDLAELAQNTEETEAFRQYYAANGFNTLMFPVAANLAPNPVLTMQSLEMAIAQALVAPPTPAGNRPRRNTNNKWALLIPPALEMTAKAILNATQIKITDANGTEFLTNNPISGVVPVVVPWLSLIATGTTYANTTGWALVPYGGEGYYGNTVTNVYLRGLEVPELRIKNDQGQALGGGSLSPYDGSFDYDGIQIRLRQFVKGNIENNFGTVWSKGTAVASTVV